MNRSKNNFPSHYIEWDDFEDEIVFRWIVNKLEMFVVVYTENRLHMLTIAVVM